ncbi:hypothetical protein [Pacificispira sp.]|uniref:hypothetical protein n=1 Tax=Pacificispira sp. TaxID=2888761 RepID=UPI003BAA1CE3
MTEITDTYIRTVLEQSGIPVDEDGLREAVHRVNWMNENGYSRITQGVADRLLLLHAERLFYYMNPSSYRWYQRIGMALYFLFGSMTGKVRAFRQNQRIGIAPFTQV